MAARLPTMLIRLLLLAGVALASAGCGDARVADGFERVSIADNAFLLEVVDDDATRQKGLMNRTEIPEDGGMLFVFPDASYRSFWMAYCLVDMDLIFLDGRGRVTAIHRMKVEPPRREDETVAQYEARMMADASYPSHYPAQFAIELKAGWLDRLNLQVDDKIELDLARLKAEAE